MLFIVQDFGIYALLLTLSAIGVPNAVAKMISERVSQRDQKGAHRIFKVSFFTFASIGFCCSTVLFVGAKYISNNILEIPEAEKSLIALSPSIFFVSVISVIRGYFNGMQTMKATANSQTIEQLLKTILTIIFVEIAYNISNANTTIMAASSNLATTFATMGSFFYLYKYYKFRQKYISYEIRKSVKHKRQSIISIIKNILYVTIPMSFTSILMSINKNVDSITVVRGLKKILGSQEAKIQYGILSGKVDTLINLPLSFNMAFAIALVPAVSAAFAKKNNAECIKKISLSILITILIGMPSTVIMVVFSKQILKLLFPNACSGYIVLQISAISILFTMLCQTINGALQGVGKILTPAISLSIGVIIKVILNLILVPLPSQYYFFGGVNGAATATVICHITAFLISFFALKEKIKIKLKVSKFFIKPCLATVIMIGVMYILNEVLNGIMIEKMAIILSILIAVIIYIISVGILKIFEKEEIELLPYGNNIVKIMEKTGIY